MSDFFSLNELPAKAYFRWLPSVTLFIYKIVQSVNKLHCLISKSTWKFDQNESNTKCCQYSRLQLLQAEKALDILAEPQSQLKCKKDIFK